MQIKLGFEKIENLIKNIGIEMRFGIATKMGITLALAFEWIHS